MYILNMTKYGENWPLVVEKKILTRYPKMSFSLIFLKTCRISIVVLKRIEFNLTISSVKTPMQVAYFADHSIFGTQSP